MTTLMGRKGTKKKRYNTPFFAEKYFIVLFFETQHFKTNHRVTDL